MSVIVYGNHAHIIQSMIDFDFLVGKSSPGIVALVGVDRQSVSFFWGKNIVSLPCFATAADIDILTRDGVDDCIVLQSARRVRPSTFEAVEYFPSLRRVSIFAEGVPERHAQDIHDHLKDRSNTVVLGPASVGAVDFGRTKLGAAGGITPTQIDEARLTVGADSGIAIISVSGGMLNELISVVNRYDKTLHSAQSVGGDLVCITQPSQLLKQLIDDDSVSAIVFYGELGGVDEYEMATTYKNSKTEKPFISFIAGKVSENFSGDAPQFGHAKAIARTSEQTASAKVTAMKEAGIDATISFGEFEKSISKVKVKARPKTAEGYNERLKMLENRKTPLFMSSVSSEVNGDAIVMDELLVDFVANKSFSQAGLELLLARKLKSQKTIELSDLVLRLLIDHGPLVSGAMNTIVSARAGKDLVSSVASGLLTVGDRFGGAVNQSAQHWLEGVRLSTDPAEFVENMAKSQKRIAGIGHKKYSAQKPDPRIDMLRKHIGQTGEYTAFADRVAEITITKKSNLILNVDGAIAAIMLDVLSAEEHMSHKELEELVEVEFFNSLFVLSRSFGFAAHFMDQKRHDQPLFRLPEEQSGHIL